MRTGLESETFHGAEPRREVVSSGRSFVIDPVCAFDFGHSLNALKYFTEVVRNRWGHAEALASYHLAAPADRSDGIVRFFDFYYDKFIKIDRKNIRYNGFGLSAPSKPLKRALADYSNLFFYREIGKADRFVFPNIDIYSLLAIMAILGGMDVASAPALYLRFIGVMEHARYFADEDFGLAVEQLRRLMKSGFRIAISAETPTLARVLRDQLGCHVGTTPYPLVSGDMLPLPAGPFTALFGGSARADKGFARIPAIVRRVNAGGFDGIRFLVQNAPPGEQMSHLDTIVELSKIDNVTLLDGVLTFSEILDAYAQASISIMPYDPAVYAARGSAILMESIMFGRLVVGQADTAFSEQIMTYNSGEIARSDEEFAKSILRLSSLPKRYLEQQADAARRRYTDDIKSCYDGWFGGLS